MELICDKRETKVFCYAKDQAMVKSEFLTIGDFLLGIRVRENFIPLVIVERKTWSDLAASIKDGRIKNIQKLRSFRDETGAKIAYLLEGAPPKNPASNVDGIPYKNLRAHLDHLLFRDSVIELHSSGPSDSLRRLLEFLNNLKKYGEERAGAELGPEFKDGITAAKVKTTLSDEQIKDKLWSSFDGISLSSAPAFRHLSIKKLYLGEISAEDLAETQVGAKKFGPRRAGAIISGLSKETSLEKLLCALPGISSKRARLVLDCLVEDTTPLPLENFFRNWSDIKSKVEGKVGKKCMQVLERHLITSKQDQSISDPSPQLQTL